MWISRRKRFFQRYYEKKVLPKTAAINVEEYVNYFRPFVEQGYEVVHLNRGSALSSAHQNCMLAARELKGVYPVDSGNLSTGIGHLVLDAGEMISDGMGSGRNRRETKREKKPGPFQFCPGYSEIHERRRPVQQCTGSGGESPEH